MKRFAPATGRNREPIREVLAKHLPEAGLVLEIACGTGEHAAYFAAAFPHLEWQPTDVDADALSSATAWYGEAGLANLRVPMRLDVVDAAWPVPSAAAVVCINMIHIVPWDVTLAMFAGAARTLPVGGLLYTYGPYRFEGSTAPSNEDFDRSLRDRDDRWGVRDVRDLSAITEFKLEETIAMPANNHSLIFRRAH
ncbi:MAG: DUF938 domain-containing protein [Deltaproteobacteria bacterium]|nr:DUF938 domain-containing protein [Deltaproteobacteria bacterium]MDQ3300756.1 class I SAM-dependent methyltransferase [Myxococcota bacterium]